MQDYIKFGILPSMYVNFTDSFRKSPYRVRDWKTIFDPTLTNREPSLVLVRKFCLYRKA